MFGGGDPSIPNLVPSDIVITRNHLSKPLRWKKDDPSFEGTEWAVKNLFELKNARRVLVDGNLLEYNWPQAQNGFAILFTVRNQDGGAPWSVIEDVTFSNNVVRHVAAGINILGRDDNHQERAGAAHCDSQQRVPGRGRRLGLWPAVPAARGHPRRRHRQQHRVPDRQPALRRRSSPAHRVRLRRATSCLTTSMGLPLQAPAPATTRWPSSSPARCSGATCSSAETRATTRQTTVFRPRSSAIGATPPQPGAKLALPQLTLRGSTGRGGTEGRPPGADIAAVQKALGPLVNRLGS